jgi:hypothetical protein
MLSIRRVKVKDAPRFVGSAACASQGQSWDRFQPAHRFTSAVSDSGGATTRERGPTFAHACIARRGARGDLPASSYPKMPMTLAAHRLLTLVPGVTVSTLVDDVTPRVPAPVVGADTIDQRRQHRR